MNLTKMHVYTYMYIQYYRITDLVQSATTHSIYFVLLTCLLFLVYCNRIWHQTIPHLMSYKTNRFADKAVITESLCNAHTTDTFKKHYILTLIIQIRILAKPMNSCSVLIIICYPRHYQLLLYGLRHSFLQHWNSYLNMHTQTCSHTKACTSIYSNFLKSTCLKVPPFRFCQCFQDSPFQDSPACIFNKS